MEQERDNLSQQNVEEIIGTTVCLETEIPGECVDGTPGINYVYGSSGFFVERDKIATNFHVIAGCHKITAKQLDTNNEYTIEGILAFDVISDLAILKTSEKDTPFILGNSEIVQKNDRICALGYHGDKENRVYGAVQMPRKRGKNIRLKVQLGKGWSGSPILNNKGEVVAIYFGCSKSGRVGYAVPANTLKALLTDAENAKVESLSTWGRRLENLLHTEYKLDECGRYKRMMIILRVIWQSVKGIFYSLRARAKATSGDHEGAIAIYDKIIASKLVLTLQSAYASRGIVKSKLRNYQDAIEDANEAILLDPESYNGYYCRGYANQALGKSKANQEKNKKAGKLYKEAISNYTEAINLNPEKTKIYHQRAWTRYLLGQVETKKGNRKKAKKLFQAAISDGNEALQLKLKSAKYRSAFYHTCGAAKAALGDHNAAIEDYDESVRLNPKKALFYHDRGLSKEALEQHEAAEADFAKSKELDPKLEK